MEIRSSFFSFVYLQHYCVNNLSLPLAPVISVGVTSDFPKFHMICWYMHVPEAVLGVVGEVGERGLVDVEHPHLPAVAGELEPLGVGDGLVDDDAGVPAVVPAEHVVADVALAAGRHRLPVALVVRLHGQAPAVARHAGAPAELPGGAHQRAQRVDQRRRRVPDLIVQARRGFLHRARRGHPDAELPRGAGGAAGGGHEGHEEGDELGHR
jgi:hypothetical protein